MPAQKTPHQIWVEALAPADRAVFDEISRRPRTFDPARKARTISDDQAREMDRLLDLYRAMKNGERVTWEQVTGAPVEAPVAVSAPRKPKKRSTFREQARETVTSAPTTPAPKSAPAPTGNGPKAGHLEFLVNGEGPGKGKLVCLHCLTADDVTDIGTAYKVAQEHAEARNCPLPASRHALQHETSVWCYRCGWASDPVWTLGAAYSAARDHIDTVHGGAA